MQMATGPNSCFSNMYEDVVLTSSLDSATNGGSSENHSTSLLYNLSLLREKVQQVQSLATAFVAHQGQSQPRTATLAAGSTAIHMDDIGGLLQEIIVTASSMMFSCQNISLNASQGNPTNGFGFDNLSQPNNHEQNVFEWCGGGASTYGNSNNADSNNNNDNTAHQQQKQQQADRDRDKKSTVMLDRNNERLSPMNYDIIEMDAADLLAKYTHYCQVCGKGFKRDANLRMHMRAHGDEYKSTAALTNPAKHNNDTNSGCELNKVARKYSCPQEGCRWNKKHAKFQPLKSMICVKNHYKRSHCPKMYVCKRCNRKQFSVLSDLRTHEKHCGDVKWQCSCGTTFSRKDKLMGHVGLFIGHTPAVVNMMSSSSNSGSMINEAARNAVN